MRIIRLRFIALLSIICLMVSCAYLMLSWRYAALEESDELIKDAEDEIQQACRHPDLEVNNPLIKEFIKNVGELKCSDEVDWIKTNNGWLFFESSVVKRYGKIKCQLAYIIRIDEFHNKETKEITFTSDDGHIKLEHDFFNIECNLIADSKKIWKNTMLGIHRDEGVIRRAQMKPVLTNSMGLNVLMLGFDSMSRLHYMRKLPKTFSYLTEVLNATILKGYNIVGDGTPQALIPILTGSTEPELPETRKRKSNANYVNVYPFVWKNFSSHGYVTAFGEDGPWIGTFTYRLKGFDQPPTDHYIQPFYLAVDKIVKYHSKYCLGSIPRHKVMLHYIRQFFDVYADMPKFSFLFHTELSHDDFNLIGYADNDVEFFLRKLHKDGILNNTLLILMSDHGHRFAGIRETVQGKQEERMPFFSIVVPPSFERKYPMHFRNLKRNSDRLTTPFDLYPTFLSLLNPDVPKVGDITKRSISLFSEIPEERSCADAGIEPHWCACLGWASISPTDSMAHLVGEAVISFINNYTSFRRDVCASLALDTVTRVEKLLPNKALLKFKKNADLDGFVGEFSDNTKVTEVIYQVQLRAFPSLGIYEASLKYNPQKKTFHLNEKEISRINAYGKQDHCIHDTYPNLSKYCYCKIQFLT